MSTIVVCEINVKKLKGMGKLNVSFGSNCTIKVTMLENDPVNSITNPADLKKMFPDIYVDKL